MAVTYMTEEGYKKLIDQIKQLESVERPRISAQIAEARDKGDLSENAEYDAAKEEQGTIEARIVEIEKMLRNAQVIDEEETSVDKVSLGSVVVLYDYEFEEDITYTIVGSTEADPMEGLISNESPVGAALLGKAVGEDVEVTTPGGVMKFKVKEISR